LLFLGECVRRVGSDVQHMGEGENEVVEKKEAEFRV